MDFSENYTFHFQVEIQSAYWATNSCLIFTSMTYINYAVVTFSEVIVDNIKKCKPEFSMKKVINQSDGAGKHFKQKFPICLRTITCEKLQWHFTATSHSKGVIDGLGGTLKHRMKEVTWSRNIDPHIAEEFVTFVKILLDPKIIYDIYVMISGSKRNHDSKKPSNRPAHRKCSPQPRLLEDMNLQQWSLAAPSDSTPYSDPVTGCCSICMSHSVALSHQIVSGILAVRCWDATYKETDCSKFIDYLCQCVS
ncbi:uncharacterized protein NPIL_180911 [Nephila pilipes]|uniref:Uncharacterized protein n=1 Tax=Nephila pilipes TaxID=299642 RepID=A0A8X6N3E5_NEPPI|nr:uncharacterized protein NPIL_180911 [Nephila pilipes]